MKIEKHEGDRGMTSLSGSGMISKADERIALIGAVEELVCYIKLIKTETKGTYFASVLERIAKALGSVCDSVRTSFHREVLPDPEEILFLEQEIQRLETEEEDLRTEEPENRTSAMISMAGAITRRAERALIAVDRRYGVRQEARQYLNRLSDYFAHAAVHPDMIGQSRTEPAVSQNQMQQVVQQVLCELKGAAEVTLSQAKLLIEAVEKEAEAKGTKAVISVCNAHGNPVAVHVMDGAFLLSFDVAVKKAYSAAAVRMPTIELAALAAPGQTFYGVDKLDGGRITVIGGGVPLMKNGILCGAIGVSGGTGEEDHALAMKAVDMFMQM